VKLRRATSLGLTCALCVPLMSGCQRLKAYIPGLDANAARGIELATRYGCASCHEIPGAAVTGRVGPTMRGVHRRAYLAGGLPNTPEQMVALIRFPNRARPGTLMPNLGVSDPDARELVAFLYTLR
jgi:cytochrome c